MFTIVIEVNVWIPVFVILAIMAFRWKMTKALGGVMMALYLCFLVVGVGLSECLFSCPIK